MGACSMRSNPTRGGCERDEMAFLKRPDPLKGGLVLPRRSLRPVWINRFKAPAERLPGGAEHELSDLRALPDLVGA